MKERPILFSAPMVRAILDGRKSQTRRVVKPQPESHVCGLAQCDDAESGKYCAGIVWMSYDRNAQNPPDALDLQREWTCPFGAPGARLWVREVHWRWGKWVRNGLTRGGRQRWKFVPVGTGLRYMENRPKTTAKRDGECGWVYRHSRFMFRIHSRITLEITDVRVQRVQEISESDAVDEGAGATAPMHEEWDGDPNEYRKRFRELWDSINGKTHPWANNDWVWCVSFRRAA